MGKWLDLLRESSNMLQVGTDKTDKTLAETVLSVSSVPPWLVSQDSDQSQSHVARGFVSFVGTTAVRSANFHDPADRAEWDDEDWQAAFEERAAILEFDENFLRHEAENLARLQIESQRKDHWEALGWIGSTTAFGDVVRNP